MVAIKRTALRELLERLHTIERVAKATGCHLEGISDQLQGKGQEWADGVEARAREALAQLSRKKRKVK